MKRILLPFFYLLFSVSLFAQSSAKQDVVLKVNGDELKGKVTKVTDADITFIYTGETLEYVMKKSDILKVTYASGRVETFSQPALPSAARQNDAVAITASPVEHHNKIAILPFTYLSDNRPGAEEIGLKAQQDTYAYLTQHSPGYTIVDPRTTNAMLIKAGATWDKMSGFTMKEIGDILGAEYIVEGTVSQNKAAQTTTSSTYGNATVKRDDDKNVKGVSGYSSDNSYSQQRYDVAVSLNIYMDNNASIYNQTHKAFFSNTDGSYSSPLEYLLKRCPLYRK